MKSHAGFPLVSKSMTLSDLERHNGYYLRHYTECLSQYIRLLSTLPIIFPINVSRQRPERLKGDCSQKLRPSLGFLTPVKLGEG